MKYIKITGIMLIFLLFNSKNFGQQLDFDSLFQQNPDFKEDILSRPETRDLFLENKTMRVTIQSDFKNLFKSKKEDEYQPAVLKYFLNDTIVVRRDIEIKPRGNMRRQTCYFPPLKLNFKKKEAVLDNIREFDKMKLVVDCKRGKRYDQYILSEYYAYKIYNLISDFSFRVRLIELTLEDTDSNIKPLTGYAFIIESIEQLAERLKVVPVESTHILDLSTDPETLGNLYLFEYLIGNTDWSIAGAHNTKLVTASESGKTTIYAIPYDFDYAGIVNAEYAVADKQFGIDDVRERVYRGVCIDDQYIRDAADRFEKNKDNIYNIYRNSTLIDTPVKNSTLSYLDEYFNIMENENALKRNILDKCRTQ